MEFSLERPGRRPPAAVGVGFPFASDSARLRQRGIPQGARKWQREELSVRGPTLEKSHGTAGRFALIELRNVSKVFGEREAVRELTLTVPAGEIFGLLG